MENRLRRNLQAMNRGFGDAIMEHFIPWASSSLAGAQLPAAPSEKVVFRAGAGVSPWWNPPARIKIPVLKKQGAFRAI